VDGWALDPFNGVNRQDFLLPMQFETKSTQDRENWGQAAFVIPSEVEGSAISLHLKRVLWAPPLGLKQVSGAGADHID